MKTFRYETDSAGVVKQQKRTVTLPDLLQVAESAIGDIYRDAMFSASVCSDDSELSVETSTDPHNHQLLPASLFAAGTNYRGFPAAVPAFDPICDIFRSILGT